MTPPGLDAAMVQVKLRTMRELLDDLDAAGSLDPTILQGDRMLRHGVERILTQLVELAAGVERARSDYRACVKAVAGFLPG
jgi:hypothetical protein